MKRRENRRPLGFPDFVRSGKSRGPSHAKLRKVKSGINPQIMQRIDWFLALQL
jgi:hypothetical protein